MKNSVKSVVSLVVICAVVAVILAAVNHITEPLIEKNADEAVQKALSEVMPEGVNFRKVDAPPQGTLPDSVTEIYTEDHGGYVFRLTVTGYSSGMVILCGVTPDGRVSRAICMESGETLGYEKTFGDLFAGKNHGEALKVDTVAGATKTTGAYRKAVTDALLAASLLRESDRTPVTSASGQEGTEGGTEHVTE